MVATYGTDMVKALYGTPRSLERCDYSVMGQCETSGMLGKFSEAFASMFKGAFNEFPLACHVHCVRGKFSETCRCNPCYPLADR